MRVTEYQKNVILNACQRYFENADESKRTISHCFKNL
jgi:hypothetical protein